eukprot:1160357-Pelagomonas_calceolata.AAC.3
MPLLNKARRACTSGRRKWRLISSCIVNVDPVIPALSGIRAGQDRRLVRPLLACQGPFPQCTQPLWLAWPSSFFSLSYPQKFSGILAGQDGRQCLGQGRRKRAHEGGWWRLKLRRPDARRIRQTDAVHLREGIRWKHTADGDIPAARGLGAREVFSTKLEDAGFLTALCVTHCVLPFCTSGSCTEEGVCWGGMELLPSNGVRYEPAIASARAEVRIGVAKEAAAVNASLGRSPVIATTPC